MSLQEAFSLYTQLFKEYIANNNISISGDIMQGALIAQSNSDYATAQVRNVIISADEPSGDAPDGTIWYQYEVTE